MCRVSGGGFFSISDELLADLPCCSISSPSPPAELGVLWPSLAIDNHFVLGVKEGCSGCGLDQAMATVHEAGGTFASFYTQRNNKQGEDNEATKLP